MLIKDWLIMVNNVLKNNLLKEINLLQIELYKNPFHT